jgi:hypothetical protein
LYDFRVTRDLSITFGPIVGNAEHLAVVGRASAALAPCCNVVGVHFVEIIDPALVRVVPNRTERAVGLVLCLCRARLLFVDRVLCGERLGFLALAVPLVVFREQGALAGDGGAVVAGGDELFEAELVEVGGEVLEEVALEGVVAVAVNHLAAEGLAVELEVGLDLFLDVDVLGVELVLLGRPGGGQSLVQRLGFCFASGVSHRADRI